MESDSGGKLAAALTTMNSMRTLPRTLESIRGLADRVVVVDSGSTDGTPEFCRSQGCLVIRQDWLGHVRQKQFAIDCCRPAEWVLLLDSDESLEPDLREAVRAVVRENRPEPAGWMINRKLWFLDGWLNHVNFPEWRLRLFRPELATVTGTDPHDRVEVPGPSGRLPGICRHDSYADLTDLAQRMIRYAEIRSRKDRGGGTIGHIACCPPAHFLKKYLLERGLLDGRRGLLLAAMGAAAVLLKHVFIARERLRAPKPVAAGNEQRQRKAA